MSDSRTALVTGGTGFIGSHLVAELLANEWSVRCLVRPSSNLRWLDGQSIQPVTADLADADAASLKKALEGVSVVFHLAGITSSALEDRYARVNTEGTRRVITAMREASPEAHLIFSSSITAAGPGKGKKVFNETDEPRPISAYGRSKLAAERAIEESGLRYAIVRPPPVYGPRDTGIFSLFRLVHYGIAPHIASTTQRLSLVHVSDLVRGLMLIVESDGRGLYYMTDGSTHTWEEVINEIGRALNRKPKFVAVSPGVADVVAKLERIRGVVMGGKPLLTPDRLLELSQNEWTCSDVRARLDLNYESTISLPEGIASTAEWYRAQGWLPR